MSHDFLSAAAPFQLGYVTTDISKAIEVWSATHGVSDFLVREPADVTVTSEGRPLQMRLQLAFAYWGDVTVELIEPISGSTGVYSALLPARGFGMAFHHLGFLVRPDLDAWQQLIDEVDSEHVIFSGEVEDHTKFLYRDTRATHGHITEYIWWNEQRKQWLSDVPRNDVLQGESI
jgi:methylmalonyl-CoA/ethylmalonyl-CoA epimerase